MADYLVRVELFDADGDEYETLHENMKAIGFSKTIQAPGSETRKLPTGTYIGTKIEAVADVRDAIRRVADPLSSKAAAVFVCAFTDWASYLYTDS